MADPRPPILYSPVHLLGRQNSVYIYKTVYIYIHTHTHIYILAGSIDDDGDDREGKRNRRRNRGGSRLEARGPNRRGAVNGMDIYASVRSRARYSAVGARRSNGAGRVFPSRSVSSCRGPPSSVLDSISRRRSGTARRGERKRSIDTRIVVNVGSARVLR